MKFLDFLVEQKVISSEKALEIKNKVSSGYSSDINKLIEESVEANILAIQKGAFYNLPVKTLDQENNTKIDQNVLKFIPEESAIHYRFVPIELVDGILEVGVTNPENIESISALQFLTSKANIGYKIFVITNTFFDKISAGYTAAHEEIGKALSDFNKSDFAEFENEKEVDMEALQIQNTLKPGEEERIVEDAPIIKIVSSIIRHAVDGGASDIHIENTGTQVKVRFREDGILHTSFTLPVKTFPGIIARIKILARLRLDEKRKPQDGSFTAKIEDRKIDFRVSTFPAYYGEKVVLRILDSDRGLKKLIDLGMTTKHLDMVKKALAKPYGLILLTGPTGSGKTASLYAMLNELDRESLNVVSLEEPVEFTIPNVSQSQVMPEIDYTFANGLRSILRQDPNIIMVGEIRDKETAQLAIQAALTGHLVLSTLHTNTSIGVISRLVDMGVDPYLIAPTLILSIGQRLVRKICPTSKHQIPIDDILRKQIDEDLADLPENFKKELSIGDKIYESVASPECASGTKGRMAIFEMFEVDNDIQKIILNNPTDIDLYKKAREKGMLTIKEDAMIKAIAGDISYQEIYAL